MKKMYDTKYKINSVKNIVYNSSIWNNNLCVVGSIKYKCISKIAIKKTVQKINDVTMHDLIKIYCL